MVETAFDVDRQHYTRRRPNRVPVILEAEGTQFTADFVVGVEVPCGSSSVELAGRLHLIDSGHDERLASPPEVELTVPDLVDCGGASTPLTAGVTDRDADVSHTRWFVDGVLIDTSTTALRFTEPHTLTVVATDRRGAATTASKEIACL